MSTHQLQNGAHSRARLRRIQKVQFGVWGPDEIRKLSVQQANNTGNMPIPAGCTKYEAYVNGVPQKGSV